MTLADCQLIWSEVRCIQTRDGVKKLKTAFVNEKFWELYREKRVELNQLGITPSKFNGTYRVNHWSIDGEFKDLPGPVLTQVSRKEWAYFMIGFYHTHHAREVRKKEGWDVDYFHVTRWDSNGEPILGELLSKVHYTTANVMTHFIKQI